MKKILSLILSLTLFALSQSFAADKLTENFSSLSTGTVSGDKVLPTGTWNFSGINVTTSNSVKCLKFSNGSLITPALDNVAKIGFGYRAGGSNKVVTLSYSTDGGSTWTQFDQFTIASSSSSFSSYSKKTGTDELTGVKFRIMAADNVYVNSFTATFSAPVDDDDPNYQPNKTWEPVKPIPDATGKTYYISPSGNDETGDGSETKPWYNIAVSYDLYFDPPVTDSIAEYLAKAEQVRFYPGQDERGEMETFISTEDLRAWLKYREGDYAAAKASMDSVLAVIGRVEELSPNTVITERGEAYSFYVELYSALGQYDKALEYQQLLEENNRRRYDVERLAELHDVSERYQNEKKQAEIDRLQTLSRWRLWLILGLVLLLGALILAYILYRRNAEQKLYEAALEAENRMAEADAAHLILEKLRSDIAALPAANPWRDLALEALWKPGLQKQVERAFASADQPLSNMDRKYLYCFLAGLNAKQIAGIFNIETESVYTVRYRLRRKFPKGILPV